MNTSPASLSRCTFPDAAYFVALASAPTGLGLIRGARYGLMQSYVAPVAIALPVPASSPCAASSVASSPCDGCGDVTPDEVLLVCGAEWIGCRCPRCVAELRDGTGDVFNGRAIYGVCA